MPLDEVSVAVEKKLRSVFAAARYLKLMTK
jgi:hypothetical protein